jgi:hypothetical protein
MKLLKFLFGILLAQVATYVLIVLVPTELTPQSLMRLAIPLGFIALALSFWFSSTCAHHTKDKFAKERSKILSNAAKEKEEVIKEAQRNITIEATKTHAKANFKVGAAFAGALGVGVLFVFAQMVTAGLLAIAATGGVMGGYYWRGKRVENQRLKEIQRHIDRENDLKIIHTQPSSRTKFIEGTL